MLRLCTTIRCGLHRCPPPDSFLSPISQLLSLTLVYLLSLHYLYRVEVHFWLVRPLVPCTLFLSRPPVRPSLSFTRRRRILLTFLRSPILLHVALSFLMERLYGVEDALVHFSSLTNIFIVRDVVRKYILLNHLSMVSSMTGFPDIFFFF